MHLCTQSRFSHFYTHILRHWTSHLRCSKRLVTRRLRLEIWRDKFVTQFVGCCVGAWRARTRGSLVGMAVVRLSVYMCLYVQDIISSTRVCLFVSICVRQECVFLFMCTHIHMSMCVCVYVGICTRVCTRTHIHRSSEDGSRCSGYRMQVATPRNAQRYEH